MFPVQVGSDNDWKSIACGTQTVALKTNGSLWSWGQNQYGQLGDGTNVNKNIPTMISNESGWLAVDCGDTYTLALKIDGSLWAWGRNHYGTLGDGTNVNKSIPTQIGTDTDWKKLSTPITHSQLIKNDGTLWVTGLNDLGQLGDGTTVDKNILTQIGCWPTAVEQVTKINFKMNYHQRQLSFDNQSIYLLEAKLFDILGRQVQQFEIQRGISRSDIGIYAQGIYFVNVYKKGNIIKSEKFS
ncbi:MAG: T9SS type A sorting domain-containing protein [Bacteroidetes bacterium]|nr:T9SS type A sorting domain-containing protein [Bacteroidota bacterium]